MRRSLLRGWPFYFPWRPSVSFIFAPPGQFGKEASCGGHKGQNGQVQRARPLVRGRVASALRAMRLGIEDAAQAAAAGNNVLVAHWTRVELNHLPPICKNGALPDELLAQRPGQDLNLHRISPSRRDLSAQLMRLPFRHPTSKL